MIVRGEEMAEVNRAHTPLSMFLDKCWPPGNITQHLATKCFYFVLLIGVRSLATLEGEMEELGGVERCTQFKKQRFRPRDVKRFPPVSDCSVVSKLMGRVALSQLSSRPTVKVDSVNDSVVTILRHNTLITIVSS